MITKRFFNAALFLCGMAFSSLAVVSCDDDNGSAGGGGETDTDAELDYAANIDYTAENSASWRNYALQVAILLQQDANTLYSSWNDSYDGGAAYKETFKNHNASPYTDVTDCIYMIVDKCYEITDEVGNEKIGDPYRKWNAGNYTEALYAVESWYSYHSRDDYANNIRSIRNSYFNSLDSTINDHSLYRVIESVDADLNKQISDAIETAKNAILAIPQPFRNHINDATVPVAQEKCIDLGTLFNINLRAAIQNGVNSGAISKDELNLVVNEYVDKVILPTYYNLQVEVGNLYSAVRNFYNDPSNETFEEACDAWIVAREPWEQSEAFLFGPVDALGLDPNMDSWPLDQVAIVNILNSGNFDDLNWSDDDTEDEITASQEVRGFHTLEFLLFKNGNPRTVPEE